MEEGDADDRDGYISDAYVRQITIADEPDDSSVEDDCPCDGEGCVGDTQVVPVDEGTPIAAKRVETHLFGIFVRSRSE